MEGDDYGTRISLAIKPLNIYRSDTESFKPFPVIIDVFDTNGFSTRKGILEAKFAFLSTIIITMQKDLKRFDTILPTLDRLEIIEDVKKCREFEKRQLVFLIANKANVGSFLQLS
jgi:hypothetical protein